MGFQIGIKDIIDIFLVALLMYQLFRFVKKTGTVSVFFGILAFIAFWFLVTYIFRMELLGAVLDRIVSVGAFGLIVIFQEEIRRFFARIGSSKKKSFVSNLRKLLKGDQIDQNDTDINIIQIVLACRNLSKTNTGGLIVLTRTNSLELYIHSGEILNSNISSRLIENIFFKNSPLHDGALIISDRTLKAASCILPVTKNHSIPKRLGLRHRAAIGITETTDAIAIVVSEETGYISWAVNGQLTQNVKPEQLENFLSGVFTD